MVRQHFADAGANVRDQEVEEMKVRIKLKRDKMIVYEGVHAARDAEEFGEAFKAVWDKLHARQMEQPTSIG